MFAVVETCPVYLLINRTQNQFANDTFATTFLQICIIIP